MTGTDRAAAAADTVGDAEVLDELLATIADEYAPELGAQARVLLHRVIGSIERKDRLLRRLEEQRDAALQRVQRLEGRRRAIRSWVRVHQDILGDRLHENPRSKAIIAKLELLDEVARCLDHLDDEPQPPADPPPTAEEPACP